MNTADTEEASVSTATDDRPRFSVRSPVRRRVGPRLRLVGPLAALALAFTGAGLAASAPAGAATPQPYCTASGNPPTVRDAWGRGPFPTVWCFNLRNQGVYYRPGNTPKTGVLLGNRLAWFVCQKQVGNVWYAYTQGDIPDPGYPQARAWGWVNALYLKGATAKSPVPGLVNCSRYGV